jgi:divalent metal cation (Fe/Co/Zn/Cd) transporter
VQKAKLFFVALAAFAVGFVGAYWTLAMVWTHVFTRPENVTATDFYLVVALAAIAGSAFSGVFTKLVARRFWSIRQVGHAAHA